MGYPTVDISLQALKALTGEGESEGVDLVEVGMPYSDPMMDGVTIQRAGTKALLARASGPVMHLLPWRPWRVAAYRRL